MQNQNEIDELASDFEKCRKILLAFGDENRRHVILEMKIYQKLLVID